MMKRKCIMKYDEMKKQLQDLSTELGAELISFDYYRKVFGNMIVKIRKADMIYEFITDRGEISCNNSLICDSSYHQAGRDDTFTQLIDIIKKILK